ncbi:glycoside hydrolase family 11 protein [Thozetella sp. PMI_491]|nr:glycoside hydrolase family 11 protein [Thozetella sp. PMI_491]
MISLSHLALALSALGGVFAAPTADPDAPDFVIGPHNLARRQDYNQNYKTGGNVNFSPSSNGYSVTFSGAGDFVVGKGWKTGSERNITFDGSTSRSSGTVLVSVYGWTKNPLVEYYVQEYTSDNKGSAQGTKVGTIESDGSTYDVWKHTQNNQPSIVGTATFTQYISNRRDPRPGSGTVTIKNHFDGWKKLGLNLGTHDYQVLATEGWGSAGGNSKYTLTTS